MRRKSIIVGCIILLLFSFGCASVRKKFVRKKQKELTEEEMVIVPHDYAQLDMPIDAAYQKFYNFWRAWHYELMNAINSGKNMKKVDVCFEQMALNLDRMKKLLRQEKAAQLQEYIDRLVKLQEQADMYAHQMLSVSRIRSKADLLLREIQRDFAFKKIEKNLI